MTQNNIVVTITAICGVLVALLNYLKSQKIEKGVHGVYQSTNGRFTYLFDENRRQRELLAAIKTDPAAAEHFTRIEQDLEAQNLANKDGRHHARDS